MIPTKKFSLSQIALHADPSLHVIWLTLLFIGILPRPIKNNHFATNDPGSVRMNDPPGRFRKNQFMKTLSNWMFRISAIRPDGDITDSCTLPEVAQAANIRAIIPTKS